jgi:hypothetical protein
MNQHRLLTIRNNKTSHVYSKKDSTLQFINMELINLELLSKNFQLAGKDKTFATDIF